MRINAEKEYGKLRVLMRRYPVADETSPRIRFGDRSWVIKSCLARMISEKTVGREK